MSQPTEQHDIVIVGGGPAAATLVMSLDRLDVARDVVVYTDEDRLPYDRTVVSKGMLQAQPVTPPVLFEEHLASVTRTGCGVTAIDPERHQVTLGDGATVGYGRLVLAMGAAPRVPLIAGTDLPDVGLLRGADDGHALHAVLGQGSRLVIIGGGVIGLEVAAMAVQRGADVQVLEAAAMPMARVLPEQIIHPLLEEHRAAGVGVHLGVRPVRITGVHGGLDIECAGGPTVPADHVLVATGARPRDGLAAEAGLAVDDGVLVDRYLQTSHPDVLAIGDVARLRHADGSTTRSESYTDAMAMGQHAAAMLSGDSSAYTQVPWSWSDQFDLTVQATGWPDRVTTWVSRGSAAALEDALVAIGLADGHVVAAAGLSRGRAVGRVIKGAQAAIAARVPITPEQASDAQVDLRRLARDAR